MTVFHKPVLLEESIDGLHIQPNGIYVDVTFGGGGHSGSIIKKLKTGKLIAFDQDQDAIKNNVNNDKKLILINKNFRFLKEQLAYKTFGKPNNEEKV